MFKLLKTEDKARRGEFTCPHGTVQTPVFMNVGTQAAIKGALSAEDLEHIGTQVELSSTYHLHLRLGDEVVKKKMGGLHKFMTWNGPILTDSGGFQVFFSGGAAQDQGRRRDVRLASGRAQDFSWVGGVCASSRTSAPDIAMAFDECVENPATYPYAKASCERTARWLARCKDALAKYNAEPDAVNPGQQLWGINQGATFKDLRIWHMQEIAKLDLPAMPSAGLPSESRLRSCTTSSTPLSRICRRTSRGISWVWERRAISSRALPGHRLFDCVMPARNRAAWQALYLAGRHEYENAKYTYDDSPIDPQCDCSGVQALFRAYIRHLFKAEEMLAMRLSVMHNLYFYNKLTEKSATRSTRGHLPISVRNIRASLMKNIRRFCKSSGYFSRLGCKRSAVSL